MTSISCESTVDKMQEEHTNTLGWDVVVNYTEQDINYLLGKVFRKVAAEESRGKHRDPPNTLARVSCTITIEDKDTADDRNCEFVFNLGEPKITFKASDKKPLCKLTIPSPGGWAAYYGEEPSWWHEDTYELVFDDLELKMATVENGESKYSGSDFTFVFPDSDDDNAKASKAGVVINLGVSDPKVTINTVTANDEDKETLLEDNKTDVEEKMKEVLKTKYGSVRWELAHLSSARPPQDYIALKPRAFKFAVYIPPDGGSMLSLFIQTRDSNNGEQGDLSGQWKDLWKGKHNCAPIPSGHSASIIFNKDNIWKTVLERTVKQQGFNVSMENTIRNITLLIDTKKKIHRDAEDRTEEANDGYVTYKVSEIDTTPKDLRVTLNEDPSHKAQCLGNWSFSYHFTWSVEHVNDGGMVYGSSGGVTATHKLDNKQLALCALVDQYKLQIECPIRLSDWTVTLDPDSQSWWEWMCGGTETVPDWIKNLSVEIPTFTLHLGSLYFFLTTNLLLPTKRVIEIDTAMGIQIPGDLYLVGWVVDSDIPADEDTDDTNSDSDIDF